MSNIIYDATPDAPFEIAAPNGQPSFSEPFDGVNVAYLLEQEYVQRESYWSPLPLNTPHDVYTNYLLVKESSLAPLGGDVVKWKRTYAQVPSTRNDYTSVAYQFIGLTGWYYVFTSSPTINVAGRRRFTKTVTARIQYDYFLVGTTTYPTASSIPAIQAQKYYIRIGTINSTSGSPVSFSATYTLGSSDDVNQGLPTDFISDDITVSGSIFQFGVIPTVPTRTQYMAWIKNQTEIVAEDSKLTRWQGNIFVRETLYIKAQ